MSSLILSRNFIFTAALIAGFLFGIRLEALAFINLPVLMIIMAISITETDFSAFKNLRKLLSPFLGGVLLNYFLIFFLLILLGSGLGIEGELWEGLVITAATPPGLAIMPFTAIVGGSLFYSAASTFSAFLAALLFTPWLTSVFGGGRAPVPQEIFRVFFLLIVIPFIAGGLFRKSGLSGFAGRIRSAAVNIGFGLIFAVMTGINREIILGRLGETGRLFILFAVSVFIPAFLLKSFLYRSNKNDLETAKSIILTATIKNSLFGAAAGLSLIGPAASLPGTVMTFVILLYLMFIEKILA